MHIGCTDIDARLKIHIKLYEIYRLKATTTAGYIEFCEVIKNVLKWVGYLAGIRHTQRMVRSITKK